MGAQIIGHCRVNDLLGIPQEFEASTTAGRIRAAKVIVATNGYIAPLTASQFQTRWPNTVFTTMYETPC